MARPKQEQAVAEKKENSTTVNNNEVSKGDTKKTSSEPSYSDLLQIISGLSKEIEALKSNNPNGIENIVTALTNRKSDREVSIVHNSELNNGLTTHMELSNISIDFQHLGETRLLSWQQFEECISKYKSFFDRKVIMLSSDHEDLAEQYGVPCVKIAEGHRLSHEDIENLPKLSPSKLEEFVESLSKSDKDTIFSYWLGKCYTKEKPFYDRHKMDILNRLSDGAFTTVLLVMNGDNDLTNN